LESGLTSFPRDSSCPVVLKNTDQEGSHPFAYEAVTLFGGPFQGPSARAELGNFPADSRFGQSVSYNTHGALARVPLPSPWVWASPRSLAATKGIVSFPRAT
jgi:hypothetical protein